MQDEARPIEEESTQGEISPDVDPVAPPPREPRPEPTTSATAAVGVDTVMRALTAMALAAFAVLLFRFAWVAEDAYITLRTVDNFVAGFGPTWNIRERAQTFTHPLWMLLISAIYAITREPYYTTLALSAACSIGAVYFLGFRVARAPIAGFAAIVGLCFARYFLDFSTSGLENPLTHLLFGAFAWTLATRPFDRPTIFRLAAFGGLLSLNRLDTTLLYAPALAYAITQAVKLGVPTRAIVRSLALAFAPLFLWEVFAIVYYGFPFPNTAYAKLGTGIAGWQAASQGLLYLYDTSLRDPAMIALLAGSLFAVATTRERIPIAIAAGAVLYIVYTVRVGGDFMAGRFLTAPLYVALCAIVVSRIAAPPAWSSLLLVVPALLFSVADLGQIAGPPARAIAPSGVADERQFFLDSLALANVSRNRPEPDEIGLREGQNHRTDAARHGGRVVSMYNVGLRGFGSGPMVHIVDELALADPLLARLPARREVPWRIGHFPRVLPRHYLESVRVGRCLFGDPRLCRYWSHLRRITQGPIFSFARFVTIAKMNLGMYDHLIDADRYRNPRLVRIPLQRVARPHHPGDPLNGPWVVAFRASGVEVRLGRVRHHARVRIAVSADDGFEVVFQRGRRPIADRLVAPRYGPGLMVRSLRVPSSAVDEGYDRIRIYPYRGDGVAQLGTVAF